MSVYKRQWFTRKQIERRAARIAVDNGQPKDAWAQYVTAAREQAGALLRDARNGAPATLAAFEQLSAKDAPKSAWVLEYADQAGRRHFQTFKQKKAADAAAAKVAVAVGQGTYIEPSKITVAEAAEEWIREALTRDLERATIRQYSQHVDMHIIPRIGDVKISRLTEDDVRAFRDSLGETLSRPLATKVLTTFKSILKFKKHAHVAADVKFKKNERKVRKLDVGRDIPTTAEIKRMIGAAPEGRIRALLLTAALTGLRASELRGLRWVDLDLESGVLSVNQRADRYNEIGSPKTETSIRKVPLEQDLLIPALKIWKIQCPPGDYVFPTANGTILHHKNMLRSLAPVMIAAGLVKDDGRPKYALHAFRHFFASWCLNAKMHGGRELPMLLVKKWMGHSSIKVTNDIYGHLLSDDNDHSELTSSARALLA